MYYQIENTTSSNQYVYEVPVRPSSGGFGEYDAEWHAGSYATADDGSMFAGIDEYIEYLRSEGWEVREASELDGCIHDQNGRTPYAFIAQGDTADDATYALLSIESGE